MVIPLCMSMATNSVKFPRGEAEGGMYSEQCSRIYAQNLTMVMNLNVPISFMTSGLILAWPQAGEEVSLLRYSMIFARAAGVQAFPLSLKLGLAHLFCKTG